MQRIEQVADKAAEELGVKLRAGQVDCGSGYRIRDVTSRYEWFSESISRIRNFLVNDLGKSAEKANLIISFIPIKQDGDAFSIGNLLHRISLRKDPKEIENLKIYCTSAAHDKKSSMKSA